MIKHGCFFVSICSLCFSGAVQNKLYTEEACGSYSQALMNLKSSVIEDSSEILDLLIKYADNELNLPPIHFAVYMSEIETVKKILPYTYPNLSITDYGTALDIATTNKDLPMCHILLEHGCNVTKCGPKGKVHNELRYGDGAASSPEIMNLLIEYSQIIPNGQFLERILWNTNCTYEVVKLLVDSGADCAYHPLRGHGCLYPAAVNRDGRIIQLLLDNGAFSFINEGTRWWDNPLSHALICNRPESVKILVSQGAFLALSKDDYELVFGTVVHYGYFDCFREVPQFQDDIDKVCAPYFFGNPVNAQPITMLQKAVISGNMDFVIWLLDSGANINCFGGIKKMPIKLALETKNNEIAEILIQRGAKL